MTNTKEHLSYYEFVSLMAAMMALTALSIDAFLPALTEISDSLHIIKRKDNQLIISYIFIGAAVGQLFYGPISDNIGRKPTISIGIFIFFIGSIISIYSNELNTMLFGRIIQGIGLASPRIVCVAMIRDRFEGNTMAKAMSLIIAILIIAPIIAPSLGQLVLQFSDWRSIFTTILVYAFIIYLWFIIRQPETLKPRNKIPFSFKRINAAILEVLKNKTTMGYTIAAGFISGAFLGFLNSVQELFQIYYNLGDKFPLYFAVIAMTIGIASLINGRLVTKYGMQTIATKSVLYFTLISLVFLLTIFIFQIELTLYVLMVYLIPALFSVGLLFGNMSSLAMQPLGKMAGIGSGIVGSFTTIISLPIGIIIGKLYNESAYPMVIGFTLFGLLSLITIMYTNKVSKSQ